MILGIGIDQVEINRVESLLSKFSGRAKRRLYTGAEITYCEASNRPGESFAARFAAKEAFFKALGTGLSGGTSWQDVEILRDGAAPYLRLTGTTARIAASRGVVRTHVSLSHTELTACAVVIIEGDTPGGG